MKRLILISVLVVATKVAAAETTVDMVIANNKKVEALSTKLDEKITAFKKTLDQEGKDLFDKEQAAWKAYMKVRVAFAADKFRGGTLSSVEAGGVMIGEYKARIKSVEAYIENYHQP